MRIARLPALATSVAVLLGFQFPVPAAATDSPLVIGVDHADFANQQPQAGRLFEYTDFFSRQATIHTGDTIDFRSAPGSFHIVALARTELWARSTYPVALADNDGGGLTDIATGSGTNKLVFGPSNFPITGGSHHGGGTIPQAELDPAENAQSASDQAQALVVEQQTNQVEFTRGAPGTRSYTVHVGIAAANNRVAIDEMFPSQPLALAPGDRVQFLWRDPHNVHSVAFPAESPNLPQPFGFDCGTTYNGIPLTPGPPPICLEPGDSQFEVIGDPGNAGPGTVLSDPSVVVDSGVLGGTGYGVTPSAQSWSLSTNGGSKPGAYQFQCTIHDWMRGTLALGG